VSEQKTRIFLVDDHEIVREGLAKMLARREDFEIVGSVATGREALAQLATTPTDLVLLDLSLPDISGLEVLRDLSGRASPPRVLVLTVHDDQELIVGAVRAGAQGYVLKNARREELITAIREIARGNHYFSQSVLHSLVISQQEEDAAAELSPREREVLRLLAAGMSNKEIATRLYVTTETVKKHLGSVYRKLGVDSRAQAVAHAVRKGLAD